MISSIFKFFKPRFLSSQGNILVYIVMTMVIFGVLGVTMVSMFSTSISSSATQNDTRRAMYLYESGIRYAMSEVLANDFSKPAITNLNNTVYNVDQAGSFDLNIFSPWFEPESIIDLSQNFSDQSILFEVTEGHIPYGFVDRIPTSTPYLTLVNLDYINLSGALNPPPSARATVIGATNVVTLPPKLQLELSDDGDGDGFVANRNETVSFAVRPFSDQTVSLPEETGGNLFLEPVAAKIFPYRNGAFEIKKRQFYYEKAIDHASYVELTGVNPVKDETRNPINVVATDDVILVNRNLFIVSEGISGEVRFGNRMDYATSIPNIYDLPPKSRKPDIEFDEEPDLARVLGQDKPGSEQPESNPDFITVDNTEKFLIIGGVTGPSLGAVWFQDTRSIGGVREFCNNNGCFFKDGIRAFFTLEYVGSGDGLVFTLINGNANKNDTASVGGDIERSEMLAYAGDSRLDAAGNQFLDNSGPKRGLIPPKIGLEFDTKVNLSGGSTYCATSSSLKTNTRNDPGTSAADTRDAVQFIYWGASALDVPCREEPFCQSNPSCTGDPSYDDNRHNPLFPNWEFKTLGEILSSPALIADGTIYVGSNSTIFFAVNPDGTEKWRVDRDGPWYSPTVTSSGRIYVGTGSPENRLYALNPDGSGVAGFPFDTSGSVTTKPAVRSDGVVYFGSDDGVFRAVNSSGTLKWSFVDPFVPLGSPNPIKSSPALSATGNKVYFGTSNSSTFWALDADTGAPLGFTSVGSSFQSSPVVGPDGKVYIGNNDGRLYAFDGNNAQGLWSFNTGDLVQSSPALSADGTRVYIGSANNILFAINTSNGNKIWEFTGASGAINSPIAVDANGHIYFGSDDNNIYALYPDGTQKWSFSTNGDVVAKPAVKADGTVYTGSKDGNLYSINLTTNPVNLKNLLITSNGQSVGGVPVEITSEEDWLKGKSTKGPWAVRLEVTRANVSGATWEFNLRAWMRQCNQLSCNDVLGTFYEDTRVKYSPTLPTSRPPQIEQTIRFDEEDGNNPDFNRFIFGFTAQTGASESQTATIKKFQLSFIRLNDPTVTNDPGWP